MNPFKPTIFLTSAATPSQFVHDVGMEIAFAGRSNAGKSSALNTLTEQKNLAKVSKTPGRTQLINFFKVTEALRLVDLPGYGYAKVPPAVKARWEKTLNHYFSERSSLKGLVLVMDARHPFKESDQLLMDWCTQYQIPCHFLLTKIDKLNRSERGQLQKLVHSKTDSSHSNEAGNLFSYTLFSSLSREGLNDLIKQLQQWISSSSSFKAT